VGGRLQGLKHKKLFYTIREMSLRSSPAVTGATRSAQISAGHWCSGGRRLSKHGNSDFFQVDV